MPRTVHPHGFTISDADYRRISIVSAIYGLSSSEFIRSACQAAIETCAENDRRVAATLAVLDKMSAAPAEREKVTA